MHILEKHEGTFSLMVHNSGKGVDYHPASPAQHPKMKYATSIRIDDIANNKILDDGLGFVHHSCHSASYRGASLGHRFLVYVL
jgi:hypothetical protein